MLHKSDIFGDFINLFSAGYYGEQYGGFENMSYTLDDHTFKLKLGYLKHEDTKETRNITLATYGYYDQNYDTYIELTGGSITIKTAVLTYRFKDTLGKRSYDSFIKMRTTNTLD